MHGDDDDDDDDDDGADHQHKQHVVDAAWQAREEKAAEVVSDAHGLREEYGEQTCDFR